LPLALPFLGPLVMFTLNLHFLTGAYKVCQDMPFCVRLEAGKFKNQLYFKHADANCASATLLFSPPYKLKTG
jgi:hypothetical protein